MMAGDLVLLGAFLVKADSAEATLHEIIPHLHLKHGVDAREGVNHDPDQGAIAQPDECGFGGFRVTAAARVPHDGDAVEQLAGFLSGKDRCLAPF